jgi:hypothetical protein
MAKKQVDLPGMEDRSLTEIEEAAENYREIRNERCALSKREADAKATLIAVMGKNKRSFYAYNGMKIEVSSVDNVKVKTAKDEGDDEPIGEFVDAPAGRIATNGDGSGATADSDDSSSSSEEAARKFLGKKKKIDLEKAGKGLGQEQVINPARCEECKTKGGHKATCSHYVLGEGTPIECEECEQIDGEHIVGCANAPKINPAAETSHDDFTAERCGECGRIDGAHTQECSKSGALAYPAYLGFCKAQGMKVPAAAARKLELTRARDDEVRAWLEGEGARAGEELAKQKIVPIKGRSVNRGKPKHHRSR